MNIFTQRFIDNVAEITGCDEDIIYTKAVKLEVKENGYKLDDAKYIIEVIKIMFPNAEINNN